MLRITVSNYPIIVNGTLLFCSIFAYFCIVFSNFCGLGIQLNGRVLAWYAQGPRFEPALKKKKVLVS